MENYIVSARKYRPSTFESVIGQRALTTTLKNAIATQKLAHAYLFCGPRGVGKTTCARIFAKTINCLSPTPEGEPCNACESCSAFNEQRSYNIHELDAASNNSVEDIRSLIDQVRIPPQIGRYKVYIIDEVHMLSQQAFNAFLKTLEEPPRHAIFILATTEKHKILPTILSRCQIYDFNRISVNDTVEHLQYVASREGITAEPEALNVIAQKSDGGMRDALSIFDQVVSFTGGDIRYKNVIENLNVLDYEYYFKLTDLLLENKTGEAMLVFNDVLNKGFDGSHFITGLASHFRDLLVSKDAATLPLLEVGASTRQRYRQQAQQCPQSFLFRAMKLCNDCNLNYRASKNKRLLVEITLIQLSQLTQEGEESPHGRSPQQAIKPLFNRQTAVAQPTGQPALSTVAPVLHNPITKATEEKKIPLLNAGNLGISIRKPLKKEAANAPKELPDESMETIPHNQPFTEYDLNLAWREFAAQLPREENAIAKRMMGMKLILKENAEFEVLVENGMIEKYMQDIKQRVLAGLRTKLKNSQISMSIRVSEATEVVRAYGPVQQFQAMSQKNPGLLKLREEFGLELD